MVGPYVRVIRPANEAYSHRWLHWPRPFAGTILELHRDIRACIILHRPDIKDGADIVDFYRMRMSRRSCSVPVHANEVWFFGRPGHICES
jgi:hypothetical protein